MKLNINKHEAEAVTYALLYRRRWYAKSPLYASGTFVKEFKVIDSVLKKIREG